MNIRVTYYHRLPQRGDYSIERVFAAVRAGLPDGIAVRMAVCRFPSRGFFRRLYNTVEAAFRQGDVNHITGDVHYLALFLRKERTILTIHDLNTIHRLQGWKKAIFTFFWFRLPVRRARLVTVISSATGTDLRQTLGIDPGKVRVIHDPVASCFRSSPGNFNGEKPRILFVGTGENKNLPRAAAALAGIPSHLRIIGRLNPGQVDFLRRHSLEYSAANGLSNEEMVAEYRRCDLLLFPSLSEGFGLPIVEAQATGRPVVTSDLPPMTEVAGGSACLIDPWATESIRRGILRVLENQGYRAELVKKGLDNAKRFREDVIAGRYLSLYREIDDESQEA